MDRTIHKIHQPRRRSAGRKLRGLNFLSENYILDEIKSPDDVKKLPESSLTELADEIRRTIIDTTSKNGGHLASNLGMVEPSIVLHRVFDCKAGDRLIFDVGHQAYAHKILTGRYERFFTLRKLGGISGMTNRDESEYDTVTSGHSGTSLSTAVGIAEANRISGNKSWVVAVIGDGSFTNGMIYEALNQMAVRRLRLIVILNDNEMSISKNVGGLSDYLSYIRTSESYFNFKTVLKHTLEKVPLVGDGMVAFARRFKDFFKRLTNSETWFESFGLEYIGPVNGNDIKRLTAVLEEAKQKNGPVIVHMKTKKGFGYAPAEKYPERYHSTSPFELDDTKNILCHASERTYTDAFSDIICRKAGEDERVCAITAAMSKGCGLDMFRDMFPDRFFDVGIAEEHAVTMSAGLSLGKMKPVVVIYSTFAQRVFDQLWHDVSLQHIPLTLMLSHTGIVPGDGVTHQGVLDYALFSALPNVNIYDAYDEHTMENEIDLSLASDKLTIIRYPKDNVKRDVCAEFPPNENCKDYTMWDIGERAGKTIVTSGRLTTRILSLIQRSGMSGIRLIGLKKVYPIPDGAVELMGEDIILIEENSQNGGIGEKLAAELKLRGMKNELKIKAVDDTEIPHGTLAELYSLTGFDDDSLLNLIK